VVAGLDPGTPSATTGELTLNSQTMHTPAWVVLDASQLWTYSGQPRGASKDLVIPTATGRFPVPRRQDEQRYNLPMAFGGDLNSSGTPTADFWTGLYANVAALVSALGGVPSPAPITGSLALPGATLTATVIVESLKTGAISSGQPTRFMRATLTLVVLEGVFAA
jgi:hypothetical protein